MATESSKQNPEPEVSKEPGWDMWANPFFLIGLVLIVVGIGKGAFLVIGVLLVIYSLTLRESDKKAAAEQLRLAKGEPTDPPQSDVANS